MAPTLSTLMDAVSNINRPLVTPVLSPAPNSLVLVISGISGSIADTKAKTPDQCTSGFGVSGNWQIFQASDPGAAVRTSLHIWWAIASANPGSGTVTLDTGASPAGSSIAVKQITGFDVNNPMAGLSDPMQSIDVSGTMTLKATPTVDDLVLSTTISRNDGNGAILGDGMTFDTNFYYPAVSASMAIQYRKGSTSTSIPYAGLNTVWNSGLAWIVKNAPAPIIVPFAGFGIPL